MGARQRVRGAGTLGVRGALGVESGERVELRGWVAGLRDHGGLVFFDVEDRDAAIQCVVRRGVLDASDGLRSLLKPEAAVCVAGRILVREGEPELHCERVEVLGPVVRPVSPAPRTADLGDSSLTDHQLTNRHIYLRNPRVRAAMLIRHEFLGFFHEWFRERGFIDFSAPVLTPVPLYHDSTAVEVELRGERVFLTQCVGFYLEAAMFGLDRVYNLGPSFRAEESRSRRHLIEYWHIKAELAFCDRESLMCLVEELIRDGIEFARSLPHLVEAAGGSGAGGLPAEPFPRIGYREALRTLSEEHGLDVEFGRSLGSAHEEALGSRYETPFWIVGNARSVEPFPYAVDPSDDGLTMTADLIAPAGYGELLGVAEKIADLDELDRRMVEKGRRGDARYEWVRDLRTLGSVPHGGFGMGFERFLRWAVGVDHVRDFAGFPRSFGRRIRP